MNVLQEHASIGTYQAQSSYAGEGTTADNESDSGAAADVTASLVRLLDRAKQLQETLTAGYNDDMNSRDESVHPGVNTHVHDMLALASLPSLTPAPHLGCNVRGLLFSG